MTKCLAFTMGKFYIFHCKNVNLPVGLNANDFLVSRIKTFNTNITFNTEFIRLCQNDIKVRRIIKPLGIKVDSFFNNLGVY